MRLEIIQSMQFIIIAFLSYMPTVTFSGWFEAWVSKKCGDNTPEQLGFLTFNPFAHFSVFGFTALLMGRLLADYLPFLQDIPGWGRYIPINPSEFNKKKAIVQFHARGFAHLMVMIFTFIILIQCMKLGYVDNYGRISEQTSVMTNSLIQILQFINSLNFILAIIYLAVGTFRTATFFYWPNFYTYFAQHVVIAMLIFFGIVMLSIEIYKFMITLILQLLLYLMI